MQGPKPRNLPTWADTASVFETVLSPTCVSVLQLTVDNFHPIFVILTLNMIFF